MKKNSASCFLELFDHSKPILGMLHLKGDNQQAMLARAMEETRTMLAGGVDAVIVENYFGSTGDMALVLDWLQREMSEAVYGVNALDNDALGFEYACKYGASFIQLDSVAGHLTPGEDEDFGRQMEAWRRECPAFVLGGVRFKYQPYKSGRSLREDLSIGKGRCDAIVVTGEGTGMNTSIEKIDEFRQIIGDFPLVVGAGMTPESCAQQLALADGAIVGSYFKDSYKDDGDVDPAHVAEMMKAVAALR